MCKLDLHIRGEVIDINKTEYSMSVNSFNEPTKHTDRDAVALLLLRLLLLEPGTNNTHPEMGVGIISKYRFTMEDNIEELKTEVKRQIITYLPEFLLQDVELILKQKILYIVIQIEDQFLTFELDGDKKILRISDLKQ